MENPVLAFRFRDWGQKEIHTGVLVSTEMGAKIVFLTRKKWKEVEQLMARSIKIEVGARPTLFLSL